MPPNVFARLWALDLSPTHRRMLGARHCTSRSRDLVLDFPDHTAHTLQLFILTNPDLSDAQWSRLADQELSEDCRGLYDRRASLREGPTLPQSPRYLAVSDPRWRPPQIDVGTRTTVHEIVGDHQVDGAGLVYLALDDHPHRWLLLLTLLESVPDDTDFREVLGTVTHLVSRW